MGRGRESDGKRGDTISHVMACFHEISGWLAGFDGKVD